LTLDENSNVTSVSQSDLTTNTTDSQHVVRDTTWILYY